MRKWTSIAPVVVSFAVAAAAYPRLPQAARLDLSPLVPFSIPPGESGSSAGLIFVMPVMMLAVWFLLNYLAGVRGPVKGIPEWMLNEATGSNAVSRFEPTFDAVVLSVTTLGALIHAVLVGSLLGAPAWIYPAFTIAIGTGMMAIGNVFPRIRPNWIVGLRTRRTLSDPAAWTRTHRRAGAMMMAAGGLMILLSIVAPRYALIAGFAALLLSFPIATVSGRSHAIT